MSSNVEFVEWHLTPTGWARGTEHTSFGGTLHIDTPKARVLTYRWVSEAVPGQTHHVERLEEQWRSADRAAIDRLLARHGDVRRAHSQA